MGAIRKTARQAARWAGKRGRDGGGWRIPPVVEKRHRVRKKKPRGKFAAGLPRKKNALSYTF
jgi:hypothetical protein